MKVKDQEKSKSNLQLTQLEYEITQNGATERPFSHPGFADSDHYFNCVCCDQILFGKEHKFDSGSGWPSFFQPFKSNSISTSSDHSHGMIRTEVCCSNCQAHLGHVFKDGPKPTGLRYCINGFALRGKSSQE